MSNPVALNLLYLQTLVEIEKGWALAPQETRRELASLQARGAKKEVNRDNVFLFIIINTKNEF